MANYSTQFSFSFSVGNKAGELIQQGLEYFCGNAEAEFGPEWKAEFATTNAKEAAHKARRKEAGTKQVYIMQFADGVFVELAKISFDYAMTLMPARFTPVTTDCATLRLDT